MSRFIAPHPIIFNGKLREIIHLDKVSSFTFRKTTGNNYGYIKFSFDKSNEHLWAYADDISLKNDLLKIYDMLGLLWQEDQF